MISNLIHFEDLFSVAGEYNSYARIQVAQHGGESAASVHTLVRRNDSAQNCPRVADYQVCCADRRCPDCTLNFVNVDQVHGKYICAVVGHNVINQIASETETANLTVNFGHAEFDKIDKTRFGPNRGKYHIRT